MKSNALSLLFLPVLLILLSCSGANASIQPKTPIPANTTETVEPVSNLLIVAEGEIQLKRNEWSDYHKTTFGAVLHRGDLLHPEEGANAIVLCDDFRLWSVPSGAPAGLTNGCPQSPEPPLVRGSSKIGSTRLSPTEFEDIPYIISPRASHILNSSPILRWNAVQGVSSYSILVRGGGVEWVEEVAGTETKYEGSQPLVPDTWYSLIVEADNGRTSREEQVPGIGFSPITQDDANRVKEDANRIAEMNLPPESKSFAMAQLYTRNHLISAAIETLEALTGEEILQTSVYRKLGELYHHIGLNLIAEARFKKAIELSEVTEDLEGLAEVRASLAEVYLALGMNVEARASYTSAMDSFKTLGDLQRVAELSNRLNALGP
jgi:hypothetical protein